MKLTHLLVAMAAGPLALLGLASTVRADTVNARCDRYARGEDRVQSSGPCTFSQRQGVVGIQLANGQRYDLVPVDNQAGTYQDQQGRAAYRQAGLGDRGQIYRLATESIYVYWTAGATGTSSSPVAPRGNSRLQAADPTARINVRSSPTITARALHYGVPGDSVRVIECVQDSDTPSSKLNWCKVQFAQSQAIGWVRSDFIRFWEPGE